MGAADIVSSTLNSRAVRSAIGNNGKRVFKASFESKSQSEGGIISWLWNGAGRIVGLIGAFLTGIVFSAVAIWDLIVSSAQFMWNFDWNMTDQSIDEQIQQSWNNLAGMLGGTLGNAFGYLACGVLPAATIFAFNEPMGAYIFANVAEELQEELVGNISNLARYTFMSGVQTLLLWSFKNLRKWLKNNPGLLAIVFGEEKAQAMAKSWGSSGSKPWSFAKAVENAVESIPNEAVRNFVEEFLEEAWEGCVEAGYVVAGGIDSYISKQKLARQQVPVLGDEKYVEITPDRSNENERIILAGPEQILKGNIIQTMSSYQLIENRDVGSLVGMPADDYLRAKPQSLRVIVSFFSVQKPPYISKNARLVTATYAIPDVKTSKLDWETIKLACGGANGYMWGRYRCTGILDNGRQMQVMGATPDEAEDRLKALLTLSNAQLVKKPTITEDRGEDVSGNYLKKPTKLYPGFFTIMNQYRVPGGRKGGIPMSDGTYNRKNDKILLWTDQKPIGTDERIADLLKKPGLNT
ncbi:hypothetical protein [Anabaena lutea]|uniref:Uncharacterized protein n=1 Tax=Anabaena lutea FACHB-196 TaxID=2692881 RepID=A0ABR8FNV1_9NOST|nr:hypothetical protein [Anabaena lutea]MBD2571352.1 hypothetical protein [Anabaena lutea FACHB-196]